MRCLLDTHAFLWFVMDDQRLGRLAREAMTSEQNVLLLSTASLIEMAIKHGQGKLELGVPFEVFVPVQMRGNGIRKLAIQWRHLVVLDRLPLHHRDPFDRLLIASSLADGLPMISGDEAFDQYGLQRIW